MRYLVAMALVLTGCGIKIEGPDDIRVIHEVNVDALTPYLVAYCEAGGNTTPEDIQACVDAEIGKIIAGVQ